jgi:hypothetical protein
MTPNFRLLPLDICLRVRPRDAAKSLASLKVLPGDANTAIPVASIAAIAGMRINLRTTLFLPVHLAISLSYLAIGMSGSSRMPRITRNIACPGSEKR